jgi:hypothetical protein
VFLLAPMALAAERQDNQILPLFRPSFRNLRRNAIQSALAMQSMAHQAGASKIASGMATNGPLFCRLRLLMAIQREISK